jgi:integrase
MVKLTKRTIDDIKPKEKPFILFDESLPGFGVRVMPSGVMSYVVEYRANGGGRGVSKSRITLGKRETLTPEQARDEAKRLLAKVKLGGDPAGERAEKRKARTVAELIEAFRVDYVQPKLKPGTAKTHEFSLIRLIKAYGTLKAEALTRAQLASLHARMSATPYAANRDLAVWGKLFSWAANRGLVPEGCNPSKGIERYREQGRERFLTADELSRLGDVLRLAETEGLPWEDDDAKPKSKHLPRPENRRSRLDPHPIAAIRLLILTGARLREILDAQWSQLDLQRGVLFLADSKTGKKPVYLSAAAIAVIADIPRVAGNPHIIAGVKEGAPRADVKRPWQRIATAAGLQGVRVHDLRHSFASVGVGASLGLPIVGKLLGQKQAATTARYAHLDADPLHRAVNTIGATIAAALDGKPSAEIIPLKSKVGQ